MTEQTEIITDRLLLKGISPALIHELFNTKSKEELMAFFGADEPGYAHLKDMHENGMETFRISAFFFLLIDKQNGQPIGECGFHTWNKTHRRTELYYMLKHERDKRKRLMSEALPVVLDFGFRELGLHRIQALVADWNTASVKLLLRHGFTKEGTLREDYHVDGKNKDSDCYSLLRHEWRNGAFTNIEAPGENGGGW